MYTPSSTAPPSLNDRRSMTERCIKGDKNAMNPVGHWLRTKLREKPVKTEPNIVTHPFGDTLPTNQFWYQVDIPTILRSLPHWKLGLVEGANLVCLLGENDAENYGCCRAADVCC